MAVFATLEDLKRHLNLTSTANDGELTLMLDAAEDVVRSLVGSRFSAVPVSERVQVVGGTVLLSGRDVDGVTLDGGAVSGFFVNRAAGLLHDVRAVGWVTASYTTGSGAVPASVTLACLIIAAHLWETQRMPGFQSSDSLPAGFGGVDGVQDARPLGSGYAIPNRAMDLLRPYISSAQLA